MATILVVDDELGIRALLSEILGDEGHTAGYGSDPLTIKAFQGWPGYRMTGGLMHTLQWRMNDCYRQMRMPEPNFGSDVVAALLTFLTTNAAGETYRGPAIKR